MLGSLGVGLVLGVLARWVECSASPVLVVSLGHSYPDLSRNPKSQNP